MLFRKHKDSHWRLGLALLAIGTGLTLFGYVAVQQSIRLGANDLPARVALYSALRLSTADPKTAIGPTPTTASERELYPGVYVFDEQGRTVATNIYGDVVNLTDVVQAPPAGTFVYARGHADNRFTWKPTNGSRQAAVLVHNSDNKGFVMATQSLTEPERLISKIGELAGATLLGVIMVAVAVVWI